MAVALSQNTAIKDYLLEHGLDTPATEVVKALKQRYQDITPQRVHNCRHALKQKATAPPKEEAAPKEEEGATHRVSEPVQVDALNTRPLSAYITDTLTVSAIPLNQREIAQAVVSAGFKSESQDFVNTVRIQLYRMRDQKIVKEFGTRDGSSTWGIKNKDYTVAITKPEPAPKRNTEQIVKDDFDNLLAVQQFAAKVGGMDKLEELIMAIKGMNTLPASVLFLALANRNGGGAPPAS